jgi:hypothetical protein
MKTRNVILVTTWALLSIWGFPHSGRAEIDEQTPPKIVLTVFITPDYVKKYQLKLNGEFAVSPEGRIILQSGPNMYDLNNQKFMLASFKEDIDGFCFTEDGGLLTVSNAKLGYYHEGRIEEISDLPETKMSITGGGGDKVYLFGVTGESGKDLYLFRKGNGYLKVCSMPDKISAVAAFGDTVFFCTENIIWEIVFGGDFKLLCGMPGEGVTSMAYDPVEGVLYFSSGGALYRWRENSVELISKRLGGNLLYHGDSLYVLKPEEGLLTCISGLE